MKQQKPEINKKQENWLAKYTYRKLANPLAVQLSKIHLTSVHVSILSIITSVMAGFHFSKGEWNYLIIGYVFFQLTILLDHIDGAIARHTNNQTIVGSWYDKFSNKLHRFFFILGVALGVYNMTSEPFYLILGNIAIFMWFFSLYISETKRTLFKSKGDTTLFRESRFRHAFPFSLLVLNIFGLLVLVNKPIWALWFIIIASLNAFQQIYSATRKWSKEKYVSP